MTDTTNLGLPCIEGSQAQKHVTHNDALRILDTLVQLAVADRDLTAPPGSPSEGERWIVKSGATGAWAGHDNAVAAWQDGAWQYSTPQTGWVAFVADEGTLLVWNGTAWGDFFSTVTSIQNLALLGIGTTADSTNVLAAKLNNTLFAAKTVAEGGSGDLRYKLSKESAAKTLSFLFQDNYSGRAEIGLTGDDNFHFKTSPDGSAWLTSLILDGTSGSVDLCEAESTLASAATTDLGSVNTLKATVTGTTTITSFGTAANRLRFIRFTGALTLTHNATSLILPGAANIATAAGDCAVVTSDGSGNWRLREYFRASGQPFATALAMALGSAGAPAYSFAGDGNTGAFSPGADTWAVATNGSERLRVDSSGNIGLAGQTPLTLLFGGNATNKFGLEPRNDGASIDGVGAANLVRVGGYYQANPVPGAAISIFAAGSGGQRGGIGLAVKNTDDNTNQPAYALIIDPAGKVGIGTTNPSYTLDINGTLRAQSVAVNWPSAGSSCGIDYSQGGTVSVANGANANIAATGNCILFVNDNTNNTTALYLCGGGAAKMVGQSAGTEWIDGTISPGAGKCCVMWTGTQYAIYNNTGGTIVCRVIAMRLA